MSVVQNSAAEDQKKSAILSGGEGGSLWRMHAEIVSLRMFSTLILVITPMLSAYSASQISQISSHGSGSSHEIGIFSLMAALIGKTVLDLMLDSIKNRTSNLQVRDHNPSQGERVIIVTEQFRASAHEELLKNSETYKRIFKDFSKN